MPHHFSLELIKSGRYRDPFGIHESHMEDDTEGSRARVDLMICELQLSRLLERQRAIDQQIAELTKLSAAYDVDLRECIGTAWEIRSQLMRTRAKKWSEFVAQTDLVELESISNVHGFKLAWNRAKSLVEVYGCRLVPVASYGRDGWHQGGWLPATEASNIRNRCEAFWEKVEAGLRRRRRLEVRLSELCDSREEFEAVKDVLPKLSNVRDREEALAILRRAIVQQAPSESAGSWGVFSADGKLKSFSGTPWTFRTRREALTEAVRLGDSQVWPTDEPPRVRFRRRHHRVLRSCRAQTHWVSTWPMQALGADIGEDYERLPVAAPAARKQVA